MALELREVEVRSAPALKERLRVMEQIEAEVHERTGDGRAVDLEVLLDEMPATWAHDHRVAPASAFSVALALGTREVDLPPHCVREVHLARDHVLPRGRVRVLEVRHVHRRAGVERVDHHLPVGRPGDLDLAHLEIGRRRRHAPRAVADRAGLREEVEQTARAQLGLSCRARREQLFAGRLERARQVGDELDRLRREDLAGSLDGGAADVDALADRRGHDHLRVARCERRAPLCATPSPRARPW